MKIRNLFWFAFGPISTAALSFILVPLSAWIFLKEDIGRIALLISISGFTTVLFCLGLDQAFVREYNEDKAKHNLFFNALLPGLLLSIIAFIGITFIAPTGLSKWVLGVESAGLSLFIGAYFIVLYLTRFLSLTLRMEEKGKHYSVSQILPKLAFASVVILVAVVLFKGTFIHLLWAHGLSLLVTLIYLLYCNRHLIVEVTQHCQIDVQKIRIMFRFGLPAALSGMLFWGLEGVDKVMLRNYSNYEELGLYSITLSVAAFAGVLTNIFTTVWVPIVYRWVAENVDLDRIDTVISHIIVGGGVLVSFTGIFSWLLNYILPGDYAHINVMLPLCMLWPIFYAISEASGIGIAVTRKTNYTLLVSIITLLVNLVLNVVLIPKLGARGAAISLAASFWVFLILRTEFSSMLWRRSKNKVLYFWASLLFILSVLYAMLGVQYPSVFYVIWTLVLLFLVYSFSGNFKFYLANARIVIDKIIPNKTS